IQALVFLGAEHVAGIFTLGDRGNFKSGRNFGRQIFQAVDREIDTPLSQSLFDFFCEHAFRADFGERDIENLIAGSLDDFDFDRMPARFEECANMIGLPECQLRSARADAEMSFRGCGQDSCSFSSSTLIAMSACAWRLFFYELVCVSDV